MDLSKIVAQKEFTILEAMNIGDSWQEVKISKFHRSLEEADSSNGQDPVIHLLPDHILCMPLVCGNFKEQDLSEK